MKNTFSISREEYIELLEYKLEALQLNITKWFNESISKDVKELKALIYSLKNLDDPFEISTDTTIDQLYIFKNFKKLHEN